MGSLWCLAKGKPTFSLIQLIRLWSQLLWSSLLTALVFESSQNTMAWRNFSHNPACCLQPCAHLLVPKILSKTGHDGQCLPFCPFLFFLPHNSFLLCIDYLSLHSLFTLSIPPPRRVQQSCFQCCQLCSAQLLEGSVFSKFPSPELCLLLVTPLCRALGLQCLNVVLSCLLGCPHPPESPQSRDLLHIIKWSSQHMFCDEFLISSSAVWERHQFAGRLFAVGSPHF